MAERYYGMARASSGQVDPLVSEKMRQSKYPERAGERMRASAALVAILLFVMPAHADEALDCKVPKDQNSMTQCAAQDFEKADKALNQIWPKLKADAEASDQDTGKTEYADALLASQRAWLAFRDAECAWQAMEMHGGSGEPMLLYGCQARLTQQRIKQLQTGASE
jgi:uncharacterized protein YecT (DUF1311 family)